MTGQVDGFRLVLFGHILLIITKLQLSNSRWQIKTTNSVTIYLCLDHPNLWLDSLSYMMIMIITVTLTVTRQSQCLSVSVSEVLSNVVTSYHSCILYLGDKLFNNCRPYPLAFTARIITTWANIHQRCQCQKKRRKNCRTIFLLCLFITLTDFV